MPVLKTAVLGFMSPIRYALFSVYAGTILVASAPRNPQTTIKNNQHKQPSKITSINNHQKQAA
jgi:hypothetical protein